jgi:hypothetical protein
MTDPAPSRGTPNGRHDRPRDGLLLLGHCWTGLRVARHLGLPLTSVCGHPHLLRLDCPLCTEAAYPEFQFDAEGIRLDVAVAGMLAGRRVADDVVCDWLVRVNPGLDGTAPITWMDTVGSLEPVLRALPEPTGPLPTGSRDEDTSTEQVASWVRRHEGAGGHRPSWTEIRSRGGGVDAGPEVRDLIDSLRRRGD